MSCRGPVTHTRRLVPTEGVSGPYNQGQCTFVYDFKKAVSQIQHPANPHEC